MENQCSPYNIWKPKNDINDITEIGGVSAGMVQEVKLNGQKMESS